MDKLVIRQLANKLSTMTGSQVDDGLHLLYNDSYRHRGKNINLIPLKKDAVNGLSTQVLGYINKAIGNGESHEATYLVGGFPQLATELFGASYFKADGWGDIYNLIIPENPAYVNAQGALNAMMARLREAETKVAR
jgi:hypothetical protein